MKRLNQTEKLAFNQKHHKQTVLLWQVIVCGQVIYEAKSKGLCIWWCRIHAIKETNIKAS